MSSFKDKFRKVQTKEKKDLMALITLIGFSSDEDYVWMLV
jgi:hypothetical protein